VRFIVDAQLPPTLARFLSSLGHEAEHVADIGFATAVDRQIWRYAVERNAVIITKDEDFSILRAVGSGGPAVVWVRIGNTTRNALIRVMSAAMPRIIEVLQSGETVIEVHSER